MHRLAVGVAPLLVGSVFVVADLFLVRTQVVLGLVVIAPLLAASVVGRGLTAVYGVGALGWRWCWASSMTNTPARTGWRRVSAS
jgi:hypothetical protein